MSKHTSDIRSFFRRPAPAPALSAAPAQPPPTAPVLTAAVSVPGTGPLPALASAAATSSSSVDTFDADAAMDAALMAFDMDGAIAAARPDSAIAAARPSLPPRGPAPRQTYQLGLFKSPVRLPKPPQMAAPDAANPSDRQRLLRLQFERFGTSSASNPMVAPPASPPAPLNEAQRLVAEHAAEQPLSVRAGAGTGKTHTMMRRAVHLVTNQGIPANGILMLTFSVKAATELKERLASAFGAASNGPVERPVTKTFHALAIFWIRQYWKALGLGAPPVPLTGQAGQRALMARVIEEEVMAERLRRCCLRMPNTLPSDASWSEVLDAFSQLHPDAFARAKKVAEKDVPHDETPEAKPAGGKRKRGGGRDAAEARAEAEALAEKRADLERMRRISLCKHVDLEMAAVGRCKAQRSSRGRGCSAAADGPPPDEPDDLFTRWLEPKKLREHVRFYLDLVQRGRLYGHTPSDYLRDDAAIWTRYESMQRRDGLIDFDCMLTLFKQVCYVGVPVAPPSRVVARMLLSRPTP